MDMPAPTFTQDNCVAADPPKRFLDPFAEWRDCANQWNVSELLGARTPKAKEPKTGRDSEKSTE